jgi:hypothetical protein
MWLPREELLAQKKKWYVALSLHLSPAAGSYRKNTVVIAIVAAAPPPPLHAGSNCYLETLNEGH